MKRKYVIQETLIFQKEVEIEAEEYLDTSEIEELVKEKAYKNTISQYEDKHGWEGIICEGVNIFRAD
jgi:hypothetical protein